MNRNHRLTKSI